jgi:hypothetical protein
MAQPKIQSFNFCEFFTKNMNEAIVKQLQDGEPISFIAALNQP